MSSLLACWDFPWSEAPSLGSFVTRDRRVTLAGWALSRQGRAEIEVRVDGTSVGRAAPSQHREDIEIVYGHSFAEAREATGWALAVDVTPLRIGPHVFEVVARNASTETSLGRRSIQIDAPQNLDEYWARLRPLLRTAVSGPVTRGHQLFLSGTPDAWLSQATSVWGFSGFAQDVMRKPSTCVLVVGSGIGVTVPNVIQLDVADYPNIDVICDSPELPFQDGVFDGVICENVIEHVPNPFSLMSEIDRVLKPGGELGINATNMHFTHGFPSHYFNPTEFGLKHLLESGSHYEGVWGFTDVQRSLAMVVEHCLSSLPPHVRQEAERLTVAELIDPSSAKAQRLLGHVPDRVRRALSTNIYFAGTKR